MGNDHPKPSRGHSREPKPPFSIEFYRHKLRFSPDKWEFDKLREVSEEQNCAIVVLIGKDARKTETQLKINSSNREYLNMLTNNTPGVYMWRPIEV